MWRGLEGDVVVDGLQVHSRIVVLISRDEDRSKGGEIDGNNLDLEIRNEVFQGWLLFALLLERVSS